MQHTNRHTPPNQGNAETPDLRHLDGPDVGDQNHDWLNDAVRLEVYQSSSPRLRRLVNRLFDEITPLITVSSKPRQKEALKTVLVNLYHARQLDKPVRYSRDKNHYTVDRRYGRLFFKYDRLIPIIDALEQLGFIEQRTGFFIQDDNEGKQTRMWGTGRLWTLFREYRLFQTGFFKPARRLDDIIVLHDEAKEAVGYRETPQTRKMRDDLERYNRFVARHQISLRLNGETIVDDKFLVEDLYQSIEHGSVWVRSVQLDHNNNRWPVKPTPIPDFVYHLKQFSQNPKYIINNILEKYQQQPSTITHTKRRIALLRTQLRRFWSDEHRFEKYLQKRLAEIRSITWEERQEPLAEPYALRDIGVEALEIVLDREDMYRVFNRRSWKLGGRAYGALHQDFVRRGMRKGILINGETTVEIDYSALHPRMLYHLDGIECPGDPYSMAQGAELRNVYKAVALISVNARNEETASYAIRNELEKRGIPIQRRENAVKALINRFREAHKPIERHFFSDVGVRLQNIDSHIMNAILVRLMEQGVLGLSVYDSVIVQQRHEDLLRTVMIEEYRRVMGFEPRF